MNKLTVAIAVLMALLTGLILSQIGMLAMRPAPVESRPSAQALTVAQSFYDDLNNVLATGDRSIDSAVTSTFVEHTPEGKAERTLPEMVDHLLAMRATWPQLRLTVVDLEQHDQMVAARLKIDPGQPAAIPGIPLQAATAGEFLEFLQVESGGVTARWESGTPVATVDLRADLPWDDPSFDLPAIQQIPLGSHASIQLPLDASIVLVGETGSVLLDQGGTDSLGTSRSSREPLQAGEVRILEGAKDRVLAVNNSSADPAAFWVFSTGRSAIGESSGPEATPEPDSPALVAFLPVQRPSSLVDGATQLSITRLTLPPGATVPVHELGAIEEIAVLDGSIEVTVGEDRALLCSDGAAQPFDGTEFVAAGEGVSARESTSLGYHVTGLQPATILVMRLQLASD
jgi:quercetin dioxygenase-like cupin family protein